MTSALDAFKLQHSPTKWRPRDLNSEQAAALGPPNDVGFKLNVGRSVRDVWLSFYLNWCKVVKADDCDKELSVCSLAGEHTNWRPIRRPAKSCPLNARARLSGLRRL